MGSDKAITVYLADDHTLVREGLAALVAKDERIRVVGQAGDGLRVVEDVIKLQPDVAVIDIGMPRLNGLDVCRELAAKAKDTALLVLSMHDDEQFVTTAFENGATGYLTKEAAPRHFPEAIYSVVNGQRYLGPGVPESALELVGRGDHDPYAALSPRERQVLHMIAEGMTNPQIAERLNLAVKTIDTHRTRLMRKLKIHDQVSLVKYALRKRIVQLD